MTNRQAHEDLVQHLMNQMRFLRTSADSFDAGHTAKAARLAVAIRVLVHDTDSSNSLLGQLGLKESLAFKDTAPSDRPGNAVSNDGSTMMRVGGAGGPLQLADTSTLDMLEQTHHKPVNLNKNPTPGTATFSDRRSRESLIAHKGGAGKGIAVGRGLGRPSLRTVRAWHRHGDRMSHAGSQLAGDRGVLTWSRERRAAGSGHREFSERTATAKSTIAM